MNGVRSISMRKGYLLTALAAAVLLAASSGTAYAQSIGFAGRADGEKTEGAIRRREDPRARQFERSRRVRDQRSHRRLVPEGVSGDLVARSHQADQRPLGEITDRSQPAADARS